MIDDTDALDRLTATVRRDLETLAYPDVDWVEPTPAPGGGRAFDVAVVGGGQSGLAVATALIRDGVRHVVVLDRNPEGLEGPWRTFARMGTLRTPKFLVGTEQGLPNLSIRAYYETRFGREAWDAIDRVPREHWMDYLRWFRRTLDLPVRNETAVEAIAPAGDLIAIDCAGPAGRERIHARKVVLATGYDGCGEWRVPDFVARALPAGRYSHSNAPIDFASLAGRRVAILGHGASAFDAAVAALDHGAASVDLCFRRAALPRINPHRWIEFAGFLKHFPDLDDATKWAVNRYFKAVDQPPARWGFEEATARPGFALHPGSPWQRVAFEDGEIVIATPRDRLRADFAICATGSVLDLECRPETGAFASAIARWEDRFAPPEGREHPLLGRFPYLDRHYAMTERVPGEAPFLRHLYAFNFSGVVSMGPHSTSISGHKYSVPRLVRGVTRALFVEQTPWLMPALEAYDETDLDIPPGLAVGVPPDAAA